MDPISLALLTAVVGGVASGAARSSIDALISLIKKKLGDRGAEILDTVSQLEADPASEERKAKLEKEVAASSAIDDREIVQAAYTVLDETSSHPKPEEITPTLRVSVQDQIGIRDEASLHVEPEDGNAIKERNLDFPLLSFFRELPPTRSIHSKGIQLTDEDPETLSDPPSLFLSVYFKESKYFVPYPFSTNQKWLYLEADVRPALNLRVQVRAYSMRDVHGLMDVLSGRRDGWDMHGPRPADDQAGDYFYVWRQNDENRLMISAFTPSNASISIHARFSGEAARALGDYLEAVGFTEPFME